MRNILLTCFVYCGPFLVMFMFLNTVAIAYRVSGVRRGGRERAAREGRRDRQRDDRTDSILVSHIPLFRSLRPRCRSGPSL